MTLAMPQNTGRHTRRKETIERAFADAKEKHAMRYTQHRGLAQATNWVKLKSAALNLKKTIPLAVEGERLFFRLCSCIYFCQKPGLRLMRRPGFSTG